jgi:hypothetical protein
MVVVTDGKRVAGDDSERRRCSWEREHERAPIEMGCRRRSRIQAALDEV